MPFSIVRNHPKCKGRYAVITKDTGKMHGCHPSHKKAMAQLRALYANVPEASK